uniref:Regulatory protein RecX n=1 Tax=candidate division WOR-3 bacterium TaxID=2052148 RepID=A0A7C4XF43_UNCW3
MKISKIEVQKRNKKRSSIFVDGEFKFGLSNDIILKYDLKEGDEISESEINELLLAEEKERLKKRAFRFLRYRSRSVAEMRERLLRLGYEPEIVSDVIDELITEGTLNDRRFIQEFVSDYTNLKPKGNYFIIRELKKKGIAEDEIKEALNSRDEQKIVEDLLKTKMKDLDLKNPKERAKIIRRLLSRGFTPEVVYEVLNEQME